MAFACERASACVCVYMYAQIAHVFFFSSFFVIPFGRRVVLGVVNDGGGEDRGQPGNVNALDSVSQRVDWKF